MPPQPRPRLRGRRRREKRRRSKQGRRPKKLPLKKLPLLKPQLRRPRKLQRRWRNPRKAPKERLVLVSSVGPRAGAAIKATTKRRKPQTIQCLISLRNLLQRRKRAHPS